MVFDHRVTFCRRNPTDTMNFDVTYEDGKPNWIETNELGHLKFYMEGTSAVFYESGPKVTPNKAEIVAQKIEEELPFVQAVKVYHHE